MDLSPVVEQKKAALFVHKSQDGESIWKEHHELMAGVKSVWPPPKRSCT